MKLRIRPKMLIGFLSMSTLLIVVDILAIIYTNRMQANTSRILAENVSSQKAAEELEIALLTMKGLTANYLLDGQQQWLGIFIDKQSSFLKWFDDARKRTHTQEEEKILDEIEKLFITYMSTQKQVLIHYQNGNLIRAHKILTSDMRNIFDLIYEKCEELLLINEKMMVNTSLLIERDNRIVNRVMFGIGTLGIILGLALGLFLARSITHPIYELVLKVKGATKEDIVEKLDITEDMELEGLSQHIRILIDKVHEINTDLQRSRQMLIRSEKLASLGQMSAGLAHEIRNPLTAIKMLVFSINKGIKKKSQMSKDFSVIIKEIMRIEAFLQNFLDFARPPEPDWGQVNINELIEHTINLLAPQLKNSGIRLVKNFFNDNTIIYGDKEQLQQTFVNIILNAIQAMPDGGILTVVTNIEKSLNKSSDILQIKISDNGIGIPEELLNTIFDPFVTTKESGTGLGLSIAHQIIYHHGGWIEAINNPEKGATFIINLLTEQVKYEGENSDR